MVLYDGDMAQRYSIVVDSHDIGDVLPNDVLQLVEQLRNELPDTEVHAAWRMASASHPPGFWPQIIVWVVGDTDLVDTTVRVILITKATEAVLKRMKKLCIRLARFTSDTKGKVFKEVYMEEGKEAVEVDVSEDKQQTVTKSPTRD